MAFTPSGGGSVQASPNVTPMIDVMLVLLIIFMVVTPMLLAGFNAEPPKGINLKDHPEDNTDVVLGLDNTGNYYLNKHPIQASEVGPKLKALYDARTDDKVMYLKADQNLDYSKVLDAEDLATKNGVRVIGLIAEQKNGTVSTIKGDSRAQELKGKH
jgi:biopolymer transport protein TolR